MGRLFVGQCFSSYEELQKEIAQFERDNLVNVAKKHSRTIENAVKRGCNKSFNEGIVYAEVNFVCKHSCTFRPRPTKGVRPNTRTEKCGCPFVMKFRATTDGQGLLMTQFVNQHNHDTSEEEFRLNIKQRKVDSDTEKEIAKMIGLNANRKMVQSHFPEKTGKAILMSDIHNIAKRAKTDAPDEAQMSFNEVQGLAEWLKSTYPSMVAHFVKNDSDTTISGIFLQDPQMKSSFSRFPEVLLVDATHKTNDRGMVLYTFICIDGNGESQVAATFLTQFEDEGSLRSMVSKFKDENPDWEKVQVIMTDKDMNERGVFKSELPQVSLEICLFHVLRTFGREITCEKLGITAGERSTVLEKIQDIAYADCESSYDELYSQLCSCMPDIVRRYYDRNWHDIRSEWVYGLKRTMNLCTRTNNRIESFFSKLKSFVSRRGSLKDLIAGLMSVIAILRNERSHRLTKFLTTQPTHPVPAELKPFQQFVTPYAFSHIESQLKYSKKIVVIDETHVQTSTGLKEVTDSHCDCIFFGSMKLPCRHILAIRSRYAEDLFCPDVINGRWTIDFYRSQRFTSTARPRVSMGVQQARPLRVMSENDKYKHSAPVLEGIQNCLSKSGTATYKKRVEVLQELLGYWVQDKEVFIGEHVQMMNPQAGQPDEEAEQPDEEHPDEMKNTQMKKKQQLQRKKT